MYTAYEETITLLNIHTRVKANISKVRSKRFNALFAKVAYACEESGYNPPNLKGTNT